MRLTSEILLSFIASCSIGDVPEGLVKAVVKVESQSYVYAISGSYEIASYSRLPSNNKEYEEALSATYAALESDKNVSLGLMQVNSYHINNMGYSVQTVFDPCYNVAIGTSILMESFSRICDCEFTTTCIRSALREYNTGKPKVTIAGETYVNKVFSVPSMKSVLSTLPVKRSKAFCSS